MSAARNTTNQGKRPADSGDIDSHVGRRLRELREAHAMSQAALGEAIDVTLQQIRKFETGASCVGADCLFAFAELFEVPISRFFQGLPSGGARAEAAGSQVRDLAEFVRSREGVALLSAYGAIDDPRKRSELLELVKTLADASQNHHN